MTHLYSSYCKNLQYDEYLHRYTFSIDAISGKELENLKYLITSKLSRTLSIEQIRDRVNNLFHEVSNPIYRRDIIQPEILFQDIQAGETVHVRFLDTHKDLDLIKFNANNWLILNSSHIDYVRGTFINSLPGDLIYDWLEGSKKEFVYSGMFHDSLDRIYLKNIYRSKVSPTIAPLYEKIVELHHRGRICIEWKELLEFAGELGFGSYVVRRLLDSLTEA